MTDPFIGLMTADEAKEIAVPPEVLRRAVDAWAENTAPLYHTSLAAAISRRMWSLCAVEWEGAHAFDRAADNMVQRLKRAGLIERFPKRRGWRLTDEGRRRILNLTQEPSQ